MTVSDKADNKGARKDTPDLSEFLPLKYTKSPAWMHRAQVSLRREVLHSGHRSTATDRPSASSTDSTIAQPGTGRGGWGWWGQTGGLPPRRGSAGAAAHSGPDCPAEDAMDGAAKS